MSYLQILWVAIIGKNPFQQELDAVKLEYDKCSAKVAELDKLYYQVKAEIEASDRKREDNTNLIEILRSRIREKSEEICLWEEQYNKLLDDYEQLKQKMPDDRQ